MLIFILIPGSLLLPLFLRQRYTNPKAWIYRKWRILFAFAEIRRRSAKTVLKKHTERKNTLKTNGLANIVNGQLGSFQQFFGFFKFQVDKVLVRGDHVYLLKHPQKMLAVHRGFG